jgi:hypothetical protein
MSSARPPSGIGSSPFVSSRSAANRLNGPKESTSLDSELRRSLIRVVRARAQTVRSGGPEGWRAENEPQPQYPRPGRSTAKSALRNYSLAPSESRCIVHRPFHHKAPDGTGALPTLTFSYRIQRAKASAIGHARCAQLSRTFVIHGAPGVRSLSVLPIARTPTWSAWIRNHHSERTVP